MRVKASRHLLKLPVSLAASMLLLVLAVACQPSPPPQPTAPGPTVALSLTSSPLPSVTLTRASGPEPTLRPIVTATGLASTPTAAAAGPPTQPPAPTPLCLTARAGDTIVSLLSRGGYGDLSALPAFRELNQLGNSNAIQEGKQYCIPSKTATPTPPGFEKTRESQTAIGIVVATAANITLGSYPVVAGDDITLIQIKTGATLRQLCEMNPPPELACGGCNVDAPIGKQGCKPVVRLGQILKIPGPTMTPTITPTLTGKETITPTPQYLAPRIVAPGNNTTVSGPVQLVWLPPALLQPEQIYQVLMSDVTAGKNFRFESSAPSLRLPAEMQPTDGKPHLINWVVSVGRVAPDGTFIQVSLQSTINTFTWQP